MISHLIISLWQEIDYILLTGDHPAHDVWLQSRSANLEHIEVDIYITLSLFGVKLNSLGSLGDLQTCNIV
jgi:hypothetical protein